MCALPHRPCISTNTDNDIKFLFSSDALTVKIDFLSFFKANNMSILNLQSLTFSEFKLIKVIFISFNL